ncbi:FtsQ-type POTRA domain-containing protein [bacterium]|nr:FtsQ-type POTRA domain-containing protein [bacterium]
MRWFKRQENLRKEDRRERRFDRWRSAWKYARPLLAAIVIAGGALAMRGQLVDSPLFALDNLNVNPTPNVSGDDLRRFIDADRGQNVFTVDLDGMRSRILSHPWVARAEIRRVFPNEIRVAITERRPVATILLAKGAAHLSPTGPRRQMPGLYYVDSEGTIFTKVEQADIRPLPMLTGFTREGFLEENAHGSMRGRLRDAVRLVDVAVNEGEIDLSRIDEVRFDAGRGFSIHIDRSRTAIHVGDPPFETAMNRLALLMEQLGPRLVLVSRIDLTQEDSAIVKGLAKENT